MVHTISKRFSVTLAVVAALSARSTAESIVTRRNLRVGCVPIYPTSGPETIPTPTGEPDPTETTTTGTDPHSYGEPDPTETTTTGTDPHSYGEPEPTETATTGHSHGKPHSHSYGGNPEPTETTTTGHSHGKPHSHPYGQPEPTDPTDPTEAVPAPCPTVVEHSVQYECNTDVVLDDLCFYDGPDCDIICAEVQPTYNPYGTDGPETIDATEGTPAYGTDGPETIDTTEGTPAYGTDGPETIDTTEGTPAYGTDGPETTDVDSLDVDSEDPTAPCTDETEEPTGYEVDVDSIACPTPTDPFCFYEVDDEGDCNLICV